ncbi:hypothetical protein PVAND_009858 [Polypedilum vanderplanki]|uniref:PID domain-containing protein n=1 Tax=Polypedilum vanderplanki TaxID=319348 RepID=A0A9J6CE20_POLVA|nr:hypothetical protein PVAND_009858 [Polypedilum vanderplanki]
MSRGDSSIKTTTTTIIAKKLESINGSISSAAGFRLLIEANGGLSSGGGAGNLMTTTTTHYAGIGSNSGNMGLEMCETVSTVSKNSIYKQRIDAMFDDSRSIISQRSLRDRRRASSAASGSISGRSIRQSHDRLQAITENEFNNVSPSHSIKNSVQAQIEKMFTEIANDDSTLGSRFSIRYLGSLPLTSRVTSLVGLQDPLRQLYLGNADHETQNSGTLFISPKGLRISLANGREEQTTPFQNIAVWSAVKFVVSQSEGGAAFLPLITDPENIDKTILFKPLSVADKRRLSSSLHSPLFAVVMKSPNIAKQLECHGFVCQSPEDAIVIAATLYQSLMAYMGSNSQNQRTRKPKNRNGIGCMSIASSSAVTNAMISSKSSFRGSRHGSTRSNNRVPSVLPPARPPRKKRSASNSLSSDSDVIQSISKGQHPDFDTSSDEVNKNQSSTVKKAPPLPLNPPNLSRRPDRSRRGDGNLSGKSKSSTEQRRLSKGRNGDKNDPYSGKEGSGDIFTKVAIPRSGSFLNTAGLTRYKSRATRRNLTGKTVNGSNAGGGGSPLGFSELFNEFRLQENLHSLDEILNAIINTDGMSFNDLKPIYKEFLLKLAVTLTKDELYQRSKSIMRRQKKKKLKRKNSSAMNHPAKTIIGAIGLKNVFKLGKFRNKKPLLSASPTKMTNNGDSKRQSDQEGGKAKNKRQNRSRIIGTSGSEISVRRTETAMNGHNRNSSSGYVSCSECSYDSDNCTCNSADRCYCSLGAGDINEKLNKAEEQQRRSPSCNSDDKCYCSMGETVDFDGSTTWCEDSDSCASASKCYCTLHNRKIKNKKNPTASGNAKTNDGTKKSKSRKAADNLALDYELFTVNGNGRHVKPTEALSVKKSVEMAAVFADVKLSQTTDIKSLNPSADVKSHKSKHHHKKHGNDGNNNAIEGSRKSKNDDYYLKANIPNEVILRKDLDLSNKRAAAKTDTGYYQPITPRPVSTSLEDSLGYLP